MKLLLLGPQGSGKSTQGKFLSEQLHIPVISTGDIFRKIALENSEEGKRIAEIVKSGRLVEDKDVSELVKNRLTEEDAKGGFILDGYPRSQAQIEFFDPGFDKVILLNISKETAIDRLLKRGRFDDNPESINTRLQNYYHQIENIVNYYRQQGIVLEIDAQQEVEEVTQAIKDSLHI